MNVFNHYIYEYKKGVRNLILHTLSRGDLSAALLKLEANGIDYLVFPLGEDRANLFFGDRRCIEVIREIDKPAFSDYTPEEDFILGVMLGYECQRQCEHYIRIKSMRRERAVMAEACA
jgi:hypothetical protein